MKTKLLMKTILLLCALVVGSNCAWAAEATITYTFTSKSWEATPANWTSGKAGGNFSNNGIQVTTNANYTGANGTSPRSFNSISKIVVTYNTNQSAGAGTIVAQVGANTEKTNDVAYSGSADGRSANFTTTFNYNPAETGSVKITVNTTTNSIYLCSVKITYDEPLITTSMSFPQASYTTTLGDEFTEPVLTCNSDGTVTYSSNNTAVAEVNSSTGALTIKKAGNATITASVPATASYTAGSTSYTLKVQGVITDGVFDFTINRDYGSGAVPGTDSNNTTETTWTNEPVAMAIAGRNIWYNGNELRLYKTSGTKAAGNITLSVTGDRYITRIDLTGGTNLELTSGGGSKNGTVWSGKSQSVKFTHNEGNSITLTKITVYYTSTLTKSFTMGSDGYMTYCCNDAPLSFDDLEAFVVSNVADNVTLTPITKAPAGTPVILKGSAGAKTFTIEETPDAVTTNKLRVSSGTTTSTSTYDVYALANINDVVGFYHVSSPITVPEGKCYISVAKSATAREFLGFDDEATAINSAKSQQQTANGQYYDLQGRRVVQPTRGLYIVNGKKVIIK